MVKGLTFQWPGAGGGRIDRGLCEEGPVYLPSFVCNELFPAALRAGASSQRASAGYAARHRYAKVHPRGRAPCPSRERDAVRCRQEVRSLDPDLALARGPHQVYYVSTGSRETRQLRIPSNTPVINLPAAQRGNSVKARKPVSSETHAAPAHRHGASTPYLCWR